MKKHFVTYVFIGDQLIAFSNPTDDEEIAKNRHFTYGNLYALHDSVKTYCLEYKNEQWEMVLMAAKF